MNREIEARLKLSAVDRTGKAFSQVSKRFGEVDKRAAAYNRRQSSVARTTRAVNAEMLAFAGRVAGPAAVGLALKKSADAAADFEEALFNIEKKSGASVEDMAKMREEILQLGKEVPVTISEIASAYERGAAAGIPLDELREFSKLSVQVADSWDMSAEAVGNTFAGFTAGLGLQQSELERYADLINYLADSGIADESGIAAFIDRVGASLRNVNMSPDDIAAYGAALQNLKMPAEVAARAMDTLVGKLAAPENLSDKSFNALEKIVGDVKEFRKVMGEDGGAGLLKFFEGLERMSGQERQSVIGALMGEGFDDEVARIVGGFDELRRNLALVRDENAYVGSIAGLSEKRLDLFNSKLQLMKNNFHEIGIAIGDEVIGPLGKAVDMTSSFINDRSAFNAGIESATSLGEDRNEIMQRYMDWFREMYPDVDRWERAERWKEDVRAHGRGETDSVFSGLIRRREELALMERERAARGDGSYMPSASAGSSLPHPEARPAPMSVADQYASYGRGHADAVSAGAYVPERGSEPQPFDIGMNVLADFEAKFQQGGKAAADEIGNAAPESGAEFGSAANQKITDGAVAAGNAFGDAAASKIIEAGNKAASKLSIAGTRSGNRNSSGNPGRTMANAGVAE